MRSATLADGPDDVTLSAWRRRDGTDRVSAAEHIRLAESTIGLELEGLWILQVATPIETRVQLSVALSLLGAEVVNAHTAWEGSRLLTAGPFDAIILDIDEPDPDGPTLLDARARVPIIAMTSPDHARVAPASNGTRFAAILPKPVYPEAVVRALLALTVRPTRSRWPSSHGGEDCVAADWNHLAPDRPLTS